jgi:aspartyl-tRNA(Asn)/glutamyl-tRNA(Gln) amidotransferase subunit C
MKLNQKSLDHLAHLAGLSIEAVHDMENSLCQITEMIEQIQAVDTQHVAPMAHPSQLYQRLRQDEVTETNQAEKLLRLAGHTASGLYLVPAILE